MDLIHWAVLAAALALAGVQAFVDRDRSLIPTTRRWYANTVLFIAVTATITLCAAALTYLTLPDAARGFAPLRIGDTHIIVQITILLAVHSLVQYAVHRASHHVPVLWSWHRIHHSDPHLDATTALRHHPFESLLDYAALTLPVLILAPGPEALLAYLLLSTAFTFFVHMDPAIVPARLDRTLSGVLMTPRLHQLHHSTWQPETDTNFGNVLVIWDRLFGTYLAPPPQPRDGFRLGLDEVPATAAADPFLLMAAPFLHNDLRERH